MATRSTITDGSTSEVTALFSDEDTYILRVHRRIGFLNGLLIGLALAMGAWAIDVATLAPLPVSLKYPSLVLGMLVLVGMNGFTGWFTGHVNKTSVTLLCWLVAALLSVLAIGYQPSYGRTLIVWLLDRRFWGLPVYPHTAGVTPTLIIIAGFFIVLMLVVLALLQNYRLEAIQREMGGNGRLTASCWLMLLLPLPFLVVAGLVTDEIVGDSSVLAARLVHQAIQVGRTYEGDLFELGLNDGVSYTAIAGVRQQMSEHYTLIIGDIDPVIVTTFVVAHFDNGAWINCRVVNEQLSFCYDASPPYTAGLASLLTSQEVPEDCRGCLPRFNDDWISWFEAQHRQFTDTAQVTRVAQWGKYVLMRADVADGDYSVQCWFEGISPVRLTKCTAEAGQE